jgi:hypothetical protein
LGAYHWYARRPRITRYAVVAALFALGLMAKPQIITFPCVLLLWDYWPLRRMFASQADSSLEPPGMPAIPPKSFWWLVKEKIPLFVISAASALATMKAQHVGRPQHWPFSIWIRIGNSIVAYVRYIGKALWPKNLAIMYLHPGNSLKFWQVGAAAIVLLAITALVIAGRRYRYLLVGWLWFLGTMVPTIGLIQVGRQALADRYAYQSFLGLFIIICWGTADWYKQKHWPSALLPAASVAVLLVLTVLTYRQIGYWKDNLTLWEHTLQATGDNWMAEDMIAGVLTNEGRHQEALSHYRVAAAANPTDAASNLAIALDEQQHGDLQEAIQHYKKAAAGMDDTFEQAKVYQNIGVAYRDMGDSAKASEYLRKAIKMRAR